MLKASNIEGRLMRLRRLARIGFAALLVGALPVSAQISLGTADSFGVLAGSTVTNTGASVIGGGQLPGAVSYRRCRPSAVGRGRQPPGMVEIIAASWNGQSSRRPPCTWVCKPGRQPAARCRPGDRLHAVRV